MDEDASVKTFKKSKSKSFIHDNETPAEKLRVNKSFDFGNLHSKAGKKERNQTETPKRVYKKHKQQHLDDSKITSTPNHSSEKHVSLKSIMKNTPIASDEPMERYTPDYYANKRKKRNKSVSFVLEDESVSKKSKSDDSHSEITSKKSPKKYAVSPVQEKIIRKDRKNKKNISVETENKQAEKENINESNQSSTTKEKKTEATNIVITEPVPEVSSTTDDANNNTEKPKKRKYKKNKKPKPETTENTELETNNPTTTETTLKKNKKKKRKAKRTNSIDNDEPLSKTRKQETKLEAKAIADDLGNLNIGDNPHTLTNLLDEMTVVDKKKKTKNKSGKEKKGKHGKTKDKKDIIETLDLENIEEKEKVKWQKRKWNKDKKVETSNNYLLTSVIVENLPLKIMLNYKKMLSEHFSSCGHIKGIGIAEVYPTEEPKPVFTTTVNFSTESDATKALEEDNTSFAGSRIRVKRPLPPTSTTLVVRSYGELTEQTVSSAFTGAGRIRNIRLLTKGKNSISTAFVEFDGPQSVERAQKMAADSKIGGKKIYVSKFEIRSKKTRANESEKNAEKQETSDSDDD